MGGGAFANTRRAHRWLKLADDGLLCTGGPGSPTQRRSCGMLLPHSGCALRQSASSANVSRLQAPFVCKRAQRMGIRCVYTANCIS
jgi:hypothetical protein